MALSPAVIEDLAGRLDAAERDRTQVGQFSLAHPSMTLEDGYAVSRAWVARKLARGRRVIGHKIGLTSRAMQRSSNVNEPDFGTLLDDMLFRDGGDIPVDRFIEPRVEVELAFILKTPLEGPDVTIYDVLNATDYVTPAIEIIDARIERIDTASGVTRKVFDTIADNAANAGLVLGGRPIKPDALDLRWVSALLYRNGVIEDSGVAAAVLNHPANGPAWLANKLAPHDERLEAGHIVLGGSFTAPVFAKAGDSFHVDYGPLGAISVRFA
ncbi:MAG TPA: 2-oxo-hepta-3-ene-1,7-dioic acid hydratase [Phenylobacterium sp.]|uniref:2-oxo-hept-4-ene-1,7-dioate hydratase n=1 Tax=Phenylobacterium sp. TaxID=1871053 RepID=UPI002B49EA78|nr:2-oxo-hepta-3-ene-1,7-dioic acid hydratase [Phenylobacterium sp.]HKR89664.1 2-oxo-hepta-3-ene-1,7-dioic acid hydratase [Phenylobacterium sp.]HKT54918.1 2-oxo-hepta-3-ene-1,7-dioic acid hydratase [Caulobacteraceae bacterium]